ncbi:MAG: YbaY family lipoprotein [Candidatus Thiodiazotropha endolucinida]
MMVHRKATAGSDRIVGHLVLPGPLASGKAKVSVSLIDATMADQPASVVAKTEFVIENNTDNTIEFVLNAARCPTKRRWLFDATVTADEEGRLMPGDFVLTRSIVYVDPVRSADIVLDLERVT